MASVPSNLASTVFFLLLVRSISRSRICEHDNVQINVYINCALSSCIFSTLFILMDAECIIITNFLFLLDIVWFLVNWMGFESASQQWREKTKSSNINEAKIRSIYMLNMERVQKPANGMAAYIFFHQLIQPLLLMLLNALLIVFGCRIFKSWTRKSEITIIRLNYPWFAYIPISFLDENLISINRTVVHRMCTCTSRWFHFLIILQFMCSSTNFNSSLFLSISHLFDFFFFVRV